ncbi:hypothetical protein A6U87_05325 [Rhizobium sp. AC44/96]|uniref:hypothetical protein n=1 Tax=Rhizobium sp. AC44/96 TaxID=1841654 RepID=UPI00080FD284|nr:hypothetical protein [Rhizobium sp. AC44/96]OCJ18312.1 hypothetical protein A6U87_05325 [Rhizobium sp. AC44/96]
MEQTAIIKRSASNFLIFAACAFILWIFAAAIDWVAQLVRLSSPERLPALAASIVSSSTLQAIVAIWLLTAAVAIAFPKILTPLSTTTTLMFDVGYGILGALTGFGIAIGLFGGGWSILLRAVIYSAIIAIGFFAVRKWLSKEELKTYGHNRWTVAGIIALISPFVLLWG